MLSRRRRHVSLLSSIVLVIALSQTGSSGRPLHANQTDKPKTPIGHVHHRPGSIDGSVTPERIPDDTALALVLQSLGAMQSAHDAELRVSSYVRAIEQSGGRNFTPIERQALLQFARDFASEQSQAGTNSAQNLGSYRAKRAAMVTAVRRALRSHMSEGSYASLLTFTQGEKRAMKILK